MTIIYVLERIVYHEEGDRTETIGHFMTLEGAQRYAIENDITEDDNSDLVYGMIDVWD